MRTREAKPRALVMNPRDAVAVLLDSAKGGDPATLLDLDLQVLGTVEVRGGIERFHKVAIREMAEGESVVKFGEVIGRASCQIARGDHVHVHNVVSARLSAETM